MGQLDFLSNMLYMFGGSAGVGKGDTKKVGFIFDCARLVQFYAPQVVFFLVVGFLSGGLFGFFMGQLFAFLLHI